MRKEAESGRIHPVAVDRSDRVLLDHVPGMRIETALGSAAGKE